MLWEAMLVFHVDDVHFLFLSGDNSQLSKKT